MKKLLPLLVILCQAKLFAQVQLEKLQSQTIHIAATRVKDQHLSSTCWSFSSTSLLESELLRMGKIDEDISEMFIARHSMLRKIKRHLAMKGSNFFTPGGQFHDAAWVMKNFGLMPEAAYPGKARGETHHNHEEMDTLLKRLVQLCVSNGVTSLSAGLQSYVDSVLDFYYGKVPEKFIHHGKEYTPLTYVSDCLGLHPDDYAEITSYTHHPFYTKFVLEDKYNWTGDEYWNVPVSDFKEITNNALNKGFTVGWDGDAEDPDFLYEKGLAYFSTPPTKNIQADRQKAFETQSTLLNHMMHITGTAKDESGTWYLVKNSWGSDTNPAGGYLYMREDYFVLRTLAIIVHKEAIPPAIRKKMGL